MPRKRSFIFLALCMLVALLATLYAGDRNQKTLQVGSKKPLATNALEITDADITAQLNSTKTSLTASEKVKALTRHFRASKQTGQSDDMANLKQRTREGRISHLQVSKEAQR